ncbi:NAD(P)-binding protein [Williamsia sp. M5A3_1d]
MAHVKRFDAVVVGAGLGGLSAAAYLAATGKTVMVLERYTALGGSSHVFRRKNAWEFDCGVHYLGECGPGGTISAVFAGLGLDDRIEWLPMDQDGFDRIIAPGFELATPVGWDRYLENLLAAFPDERKAVRRFHSIMRKIGESGGRDNLGSASGLARWAARAGWAAPFMLLPHAVTLAACGLSPRAILALSVQCGALASTPDILPTAAMAQFLSDYVGTGSYYPKGGGQVLAAGFAEVITSHGGFIRTHSEVSEIVIEGGRVTGVQLLDGEVIPAPVVVSDADIIKTYTDLVGLAHLPALLRRRVERWKMSQPLINGFVGVDLDLGDRPNSNYFAIPSWDDATSLRSLARFGPHVGGGKGFDNGADWARAMASRQPMFVQSSSRRDPSHTRAAPRRRGIPRSRSRPSHRATPLCGVTPDTTSPPASTARVRTTPRSRRSCWTACSTAWSRPSRGRHRKSFSPSWGRRRRRPDSSTTPAVPPSVCRHEPPRSDPCAPRVPRPSRACSPSGRAPRGGPVRSARCTAG